MQNVYEIYTKCIYLVYVFVQLPEAKPGDVLRG